MKPILVTGGNGFVGGHVIDILLDRGYKVTVLDCFGVPHRDDVEFILGDILDADLLNDLAQTHSGIINLAGLLGTTEAFEYARNSVHFNVLGVIPVFEAARRNKVPVCHVTVGNYWMNNPYSITKNSAEKLALYYNDTFGTKISVVRSLNAYGERQRRGPVRKLMPNLIVPALLGEEILIYGDGEQKTDVVYIRDVAEVLVRALLQDHGQWNTVFEAGTGIAPSVNEICARVIAATGSKSVVRHVPMRKGEPSGATVRGYTESLVALGLNSAQFVALDEGIRRTAQFYREQFAENPDAY